MREKRTFMTERVTNLGCGKPSFIIQIFLIDIVYKGMLNMHNYRLGQDKGRMRKDGQKNTISYRTGTVILRLEVNNHNVGQELEFLHSQGSSNSHHPTSYLIPIIIKHSF